MRFEAKGTVQGQEVRIAWEDGALTGNGQVIRMVLTEAEYLEGELVGPVGQQTDTKHLRSALSARLIIDRVLADAVYTGVVPEPDSAPPGAVI